MIQGDDDESETESLEPLLPPLPERAHDSTSDSDDCAVPTSPTEDSVAPILASRPSPVLVEQNDTTLPAVDETLANDPEERTWSDVSIAGSSARSFQNRRSGESEYGSTDDDLDLANLAGSLLGGPAPLFSRRRRHARHTCRVKLAPSRLANMRPAPTHSARRR